MTEEYDFTVSAPQCAARLAAILAQRQTDRVVFAESCTSGLVAALLGQIPGISNWLCGSAVTYRESVKQSWISVSAETLRQFSAESIETTCEMAIGVLERTAEASYSAAVTGHLGPDVQDGSDGKIFISIARRDGEGLEIVQTQVVQLESTTRVQRQFESAQAVLARLIEEL
ncbi:MAG: nicotinamide-nucleotide amidase [Mariniblastus sp.]|jgi:nicotinamide-nucleotide amidase